MSTPSSTSYLITGANRGIGLGLARFYLAKANSTVIAAVRNPNDPSIESLRSLSKGNGSNLIIVKIENSSETDADNAVSELKSKHNINALDVVIANAAIAKVLPLVHEAQTADMIEHYRVNVTAIPTLLRAVLPLLKESKQTPKFITISSGAGTLGAMDQVPFPNSAYGPSKAALNWITRKIHFEQPDWIAFPIHPGFVQTDMGNSGARLLGMEQAPVTVEESINGVTKLIDEATREKTSGKFWSYEGIEFPW